jgi:hypothetical protein
VTGIKRQAADKHRGKIARQHEQQCSGFVTFWSGSTDPYYGFTAPGLEVFEGSFSSFSKYKNS